MAPSDRLVTRSTALPSGMLEIDTLRGGDQLFLSLSGELDLAFVDRVDEAIRVAEKSTARAVVIDLTDLEYIEAAGLGVLVDAHARTRTDGQTLSFVPSNHDAVVQLIAVACASEIFD